MTYRFVVVNKSLLVLYYRFLSKLVSLSIYLISIFFSRHCYFRVKYCRNKIFYTLPYRGCRFKRCIENFMSIFSCVYIDIEIYIEFQMPAYMYIACSGCSFYTVSITFNWIS